MMNVCVNKDNCKRVDEIIELEEQLKEIKETDKFRIMAKNIFLEKQLKAKQEVIDKLVEALDDALHLVNIPDHDYGEDEMAEYEKLRLLANSHRDLINSIGEDK